MKIQHLTTLALASTAYARQTKENSDELKCTHLVLGGPKSRTTSVARALCHALQKEENSSCIHEPIRLKHELIEHFKSEKPIPYQSEKTTLCKEMLFHDIKSRVYQQKIKQTIKNSKNAIVFIKPDPAKSFLSLADISLKETKEELGDTRIYLKDE